MIKQVFEIVENEPVAADTYRLRLCGGSPDGEFVNLEIPGFYLRRPISICDVQEGKLTLYYKTVGAGTKALSTLPAGSHVSVLTGLGRGFDADACKGEALLVAGGLGAAPLYLTAKKLKAQGKKVSAILGFNKADEIVLEKEFRSLCDNVAIATMDGSAGIKGLVTDALTAMNPHFDYFYTCGPMVMMRAVCQALPGPGQASLEERMGCGAGFCYCCSIKTKSGIKRVCKDGPVFDKEDIIW